MPAFMYIGSGGGGGVVTPAAISFTASDVLFGTATITATGKSLGAVDASRVTLLSIAWEHTSSTRTLDSVTVGGVAATRIIRTTAGLSVNNAEIWAVASGDGSGLSASTSANIVMTFNTGNQSVTLAVYRMLGGSATASDTAVASNGSTTSQACGPLTIPAGGVALVVSYNNSLIVASLSNVTEDYNVAQSGNMRGVHGSKASVAGETLTSTLTCASATTVAIAAASFAPA